MKLDLGQKLAARDKYLRKKYGLTLEQYTQMLVYQNYCCALCEKLPKRGQSLRVDHEHKRKGHPEDTGRVRGLLCLFCNWKRVGRNRAEHAYIYDNMAAYLSSDFDGRKL